jgi:hypothetical protein
MSGTRSTKPIRITARLLTGLLLAILAVPIGAQPASETTPGHGFGPAYDVAHESTLNGTVQEVVTRHTIGSPAGIHLLVAGSRGMVDALVGPFLNKATREALQTGTAVRIVGATTQLRGKEYFMARLLTVGGQTIKVRSEHGALLRGPSTRERRAGTRKPQTAADGGAR